MRSSSYRRIGSGGCVEKNPVHDYPAFVSIGEADGFENGAPLGGRDPCSSPTVSIRHSSSKSLVQRIMPRGSWETIRYSLREGIDWCGSQPDRHVCGDVRKRKKPRSLGEERGRRNDNPP